MALPLPPVMYDQVVSGADVCKGDLPGHEFRGNQWTGGQGGGEGESSSGTQTSGPPPDFPSGGKQWTADPGTMTGSELSRTQEKVEATYDRYMNEIYAQAEHGHERFSEIRSRIASTHPQLLARDEYASQRRDELHREVERRAGPGYRRLPYGVGRQRRTLTPQEVG